MKKSPTKATGSPIPDLSLSKQEPIQLDTLPQIISPEDIQQLITLVDKPDILCDTFTQHLTLSNNPKTDLRAKIERDYLLFAFFWANKQGFDFENISIFLGFVHGIYHSIAQEDTDKSKLISEIEDKMKGGGLDGYTGGMSSFTEDNLKVILQFVRISLIQHFELYRYVLTNEQPTQMVKQEIHIEKMPGDLSIAPLEESIPLSLYNSRINPQASDKKSDTVEELESGTEEKKESSKPSTK